MSWLSSATAKLTSYKDARIYRRVNGVIDGYYPHIIATYVYRSLTEGAATALVTTIKTAGAQGYTALEVADVVASEQNEAGAYMVSVTFDRASSFVSI